MRIRSTKILGTANRRKRGQDTTSQRTGINPEPLLTSPSQKVSSIFLTTFYPISKVWPDPKVGMCMTLRLGRSSKSGKIILKHSMSLTLKHSLRQVDLGAVHKLRNKYGEGGDYTKGRHDYQVPSK